MSEEILTACDICGVKHSNKDNKRHWSDCIKKIELSFKDHPGIQTIPFSGDCCTDCARKISTKITEEIDEIKKGKKCE